MKELAVMKGQRHLISYKTDVHSFETEGKENLSILSKANAIRNTDAEKQKLILSLKASTLPLQN